MTARRQVKNRQASGLIVGVITSLADLRFAVQMRRPPDLFELRLDHLIRVIDAVESKLSMLRAPIIITARDPHEGGANNLALKRRRELLQRFLPLSDYVDVELRNARDFRDLLDLARRKNIPRIISFHDFRSTPDLRSLRAKKRAAKRSGADIFKVATRTETAADLASLLQFVANKDACRAVASRRRVDLAVSAMGIGKLGAISRVVLARCGSALNYASLGRPQIEGQLSIPQLRSVLAR